MVKIVVGVRKKSILEHLGRKASVLYNFGVVVKRVWD
jgi:hypothetical protein